MDDIRQWIESDTSDYTTGVTLFSKYNKNRAVLQWLIRVGERRGMSKLRYELGKFVKTQPAVKRQKIAVNNNIAPVIKQERVHIDVDGKINREDLPAELQILYDKTAEMYKIMRGAHADMSVAKSKNARKKLRKQIAELDDKITANWEAINNWVLTQKLPDNDENNTSGGDSKLTPQQVNTYRTYISRALAESDKIDDAKRATVQERITAMLNNSQSFDGETIEKLKSLGFNTESNIHTED
jgi:hypothetical protein